MPRARKLHDQYFNKAKQDGYLARSAYKLAEINERKAIVKKGARVLDLGCAPGSWLQVAAELVGPKGDVVGLDLKPVEADLAPTVVTFVGDIDEINPVELARAGQRRRFDAVISDMAPNTTGAGDDFRSVRLCRTILGVLPVVIAPGGNLAMKVFEGAELQDLIRETKALFTDARAFKPKASRDVSRETYVIAKGYTGPIDDANGTSLSASRAESRREAAEDKIAPKSPPPDPELELDPIEDTLDDAAEGVPGE